MIAISKAVRFGTGRVRYSDSALFRRNRVRDSEGSMAHASMDEEFNHAPNDSPRSGASKRVTPIVWSLIVAVAVMIGIWFTMKL
jgi:hypothetical protein